MVSYNLKGVIKIRTKKYYFSQEHKGICVVLREGESTEKLINRFRKRYLKDGILQEVRERRFYEKPSVKKRKKWRRNQRARERQQARYLKNLEKIRKKKQQQKKEKNKMLKKAAIKQELSSGSSEQKD